MFLGVPIVPIDIPSYWAVFVTVSMHITKGDTVMPLTNTAIRKTKPREKQYKLSDEKGMYLLVNRAGKYFRFDYRFGGKRKTLALGVYPDVTLKEAREKCDEARRLVSNNVDPVQVRKAAKTLNAEHTANNFEAIAREWHNLHSTKWADSHAKKIIRRLELYIFPWLGGYPTKRRKNII